MTFLVLVLAVLSGCTVGSPPAGQDGADASDSTSPVPSTTSPRTSATPAPPPTPTRTFDVADLPQVGQCRYVAKGGFQRWTDFSRVTACEEEHTAETIWVGEVTSTEADERVPDYATLVADAACLLRANEHFGTTDWQATRLFPTAFVAPLEQWALGARWVRCDVYLPEHGANFYRHGEPLDAPLTIDEATLVTYAFCSTYDPDEPELPLTVDCAEPHNYETVTPTLDLAFLGDEYPGDDAISAAADEHCLHAVSAFVGGSPDELLVSWNQPDQRRWDAGEQAVTCGAEVVGGRVSGNVRGVGDAITVLPFADGEDDPAVDPYAEDS